MKTIRIGMLVAWLLPIIAQGSQLYTGGVASVSFAETTPFALPEIITVRPTSATFTGNYTEAGIGVIGFRFRAGTDLPSSLYLELAGGTSVYQKTFSVGQVGVWQTFMASLDSLAAGGWTVKKGSASDFETALQSVKSVELKIQRSGATAREYTLDELFVDGLPQAAGGATSDGSELSLAWDALQLGAPYTMQESPSLSGPWKDASTVTATSRLQAFSIPTSGTDPQAFFRLRGP